MSGDKVDAVTQTDGVCWDCDEYKKSLKYYEFNHNLLRERNKSLEEDLNIVLDRLIADHLSPHKSELRSQRHTADQNKGVSFNPEVQIQFFNSKAPISRNRLGSPIAQARNTSEQKSKIFREFAQSCLQPVPSLKYKPSSFCNESTQGNRDSVISRYEEMPPSINKNMDLQVAEGHASFVSVLEIG